MKLYRSGNQIAGWFSSKRIYWISLVKKKSWVREPLSTKGKTQKTSFLIKITANVQSLMRKEYPCCRYKAANSGKKVVLKMWRYQARFPAPPHWS